MVIRCGGNFLKSELELSVNISGWLVNDGTTCGEINIVLVPDETIEEG